MQPSGPSGQNETQPWLAGMSHTSTPLGPPHASFRESGENESDTAALWLNDRIRSQLPVCHRTTALPLAASSRPSGEKATHESSGHATPESTLCFTTGSTLRSTTPVFDFQMRISFLSTVAIRRQQGDHAAESIQLLCPTNAQLPRLCAVCRH
eukprot:3068142-Rhodomonas_salina.1